MLKAVTALGLLLMVPVFAWAADDAKLEFISYTTRAGAGVDIELRLTGAPPQPSSLTSKNPARITLDLHGVQNNLPWSLPLPMKNAGVAKSITAVEASGRTRVVINLDKMVNYQTRTDGNNLIISLQDESVRGMEQVSEAPPKPVAEVSSDPNLPALEPIKDERQEAAAKKSARNAIVDVSATTTVGNRGQLRMRFSNDVPKINTFTMSNPARVVIDLANTGSNLSWANREVNAGAAKSVSAIDAGDRTRLVVTLDAMQSYKTEVAGNELVLDLQGSAPAAMEKETTAGNVDAIDFRRGERGEGRLMISLSNPGVSVDTRVEGGKIVMEFLNTNLPEHLMQRLDVMDFATSVKYVDSQVEGSKTRIVVTPVGEFEHMVYQAEKTLTLDVKKPVKSESTTVSDGRKNYKGEKLSLNFQDIEVRAVLQLIADFTGLNMVAGDAVQGNLTLRLKNVPWDQALDIILRTKGLGMRQDGNVILIAPADEIAAREKSELESKKQIEDLSPLITEIVQVNYAKAADLAKILQGKDKEGSMLTKRGRITLDERTNTLLVSDTLASITDLRKFVAKLDIPIKQVMIDSRIVIADSKFARDLGVRFGVNGVKKSGNNLFMTSGSYSGTDTMIGSYLDAANTTGKVDLLSGPRRLNVNLPVSATGVSAPSIGFALLGGDSLLDLELSALQTEGRGEVLSNPRVITSNQKEAVIESGREVPYQTQASANVAPTIAFKKAVLGLRVTPQITPDNRILMDLKVNKDEPEYVTTSTGSTAVAIKTKSVETQVLVDNGKTIVLGGIYEQEKRKDIYKVPFLGDLPLIGALFRTVMEKDDKVELLIFVTPRIIKEEAALR